MTVHPKETFVDDKESREDIVLSVKRLEKGSILTTLNSVGIEKKIKSEEKLLNTSKTPKSGLQR